MRKSLFIQFTAIILIVFVFLFNVQSIRAEIGPNIEGPLFNPMVPDKISIRVDSSDYRRFQVNLMKAVKGKHVPRKLKKKVSAAFSWEEPGAGAVVEVGRMRQMGDGEDHIERHGRQMVSSIAVKLKTGNIGGITRFKLLLPHTRGGNEEIFVTTLLEKIGLLSPYTKMVSVDFNGIKLPMLFQEVPAKEFLERYALREAPILKGDERQTWDNRVRGKEEAGCCFAVIDNRKWLGGVIHDRIAQNGLALYTQRLRAANPFPAVLPPGYSKIARLADGSYKNLKFKLEDGSFREILFALAGEHGLHPSNRKYYYDPIYNKLIPIYYDGNVVLNRLTLLDNLRLDKINTQILEKIRQPGFFLNFMKTYLARGGEDSSFARTFIEKLIYKVEQYSREGKKTSEETPGKKKIWTNKLGIRVFPFAFMTWDQEKRDLLCVVRTGDGQRKIKIKSIEFKGDEAIKCKEMDAALANKALRGELSFTHRPFPISIHVHTLGGGVVDAESFLPEQFFDSKLIKVNESYILENPLIKVAEGDTLWIHFDEKNNIPVKTLEFKLLGDSRKSGKLILSGDLTTLLEIGVEGQETPKTNKESLLTISGIQERFDDRLLTGCVTILDANLSNLKINAKSLLCEDAVNIIRSDGKNVVINISDAKSDALDIDFSAIDFAKITVRNAGNDCVDFSAGKYIVEEAKLINCGDKGISIGEGSSAEIKHSTIDGADIGIASKDASDVVAFLSNMKNVDTCFSSYKKKQEFGGAKLRVIEKSEGCGQKNFADEYSTLNYPK